MKFLGWTQLSNNKLELITFKDKSGFEKLEGYIKKYRYDLNSESLFDLNNKLIKNGKIRACFDKPFYIEII